MNSGVNFLLVRLDLITFQLFSHGNMKSSYSRRNVYAPRFEWNKLKLVTGLDTESGNQLHHRFLFGSNYSFYYFSIDF